MFEADTVQALSTGMSNITWKALKPRLPMLKKIGGAIE
jgi:hypothetical protein